MKQKNANLLAILTAPAIPLLVGVMLTLEAGQFDLITVFFCRTILFYFDIDNGFCRRPTLIFYCDTILLDGGLGR